MALIRRGKIWHIRFQFDGREHKFSSKSDNQQTAKEIERFKRQELIEGFHGIEHHIKNRRQSCSMMRSPNI